MLSLRVPDPASKLHFDVNGVPASPQHGVVSLDRDIVVDHVQLSDGLLDIEGRRVYYMWNVKSSKLEATVGQSENDFELDLPNGASEKDIAAVFSKVFESSQELDKTKCSPEEAENFFLSTHGSKKPRTKNMGDEKPPASKSDLKTACFPTGVRGYLPAQKAVTPPKALQAPDPAYDEGARQRRVEGTVVLDALVDEQGQVADVLLIRPLEPALNYNAAAAVRNWRFKPATFLGEPIPVVIQVRVNFRLR